MNRRSRIISRLYNGQSTQLSKRPFRINVDNCSDFLNPPQKSSTAENPKIISTEQYSVSKSSLQEKVSNSVKPVEHDSDLRVNQLNIQMLGASLYKQIFGVDSCDNPNDKLIDTAKAELKKFGLWKEVSYAPDVHLKLPKLEGKSIEQHFWNIGNQQSGPYKTILQAFVKGSLPTQPKTWLRQAGWTMYVEGYEPKQVPFPDEDALVFDVEVCVKVGAAPTLATAVSPTAWYGWVCPALSLNSEPVATQRYTPNMFIPLEGKGLDKTRPRVVVGHNVSYDRARIKEQYNIMTSGLRFVDTMSMHVCIGGVTSYQRAMLKTKVVLEDEEWRAYSSLNSLREVYKLYCKSELSKESRNVFVEGTMEEVRNSFQDVMKYCALDVEATFKILQKMVPIFFDRFPHPVTLAGMLEMGTAYLPINSSWERYILDSEQTFDDLEKECKFLLSRKADNACRLFHDKMYREDLWMWNEDWTTQELTPTKKKVKKKEEIGVSEKTTSMESEEEAEIKFEVKFADLFNSEGRLPIRKPHLPGYPLWYRKLCEKINSEDWAPGPTLVSTGVKIAPKILNLTWQGHPLHHIKEHGWGILVADPNAEVTDPNVPYHKLKEISSKIGNASNSEGDIFAGNLQKKVEECISKQDYWTRKIKGNYLKKEGALTSHMVDNCCHFLKLPHKDGADNNVGNPLSKDFVKTFSNSVLAGMDAAAIRVLEIGKMCSYWRNNKERINRQLAVWYNNQFGAILPQVVVCGTLTRRAMEPTWMTASNAQTQRVGSELRSMVQAPPGFHIVGADVDSQELWIASVLGDAAAAGVHGCTPFGWMTLSGTKASGTDMHSVTAAAAGISRDHAKVINYARIYGAGVRFAQRLLIQFNPGMSESDAKSKATKMFLMTKGRKEYRIKPKYKEVLDDVGDVVTSYNASRIAKAVGKPVSEVFERPLWRGGTESAMFNRLEEVASSVQPRTPFLSARLSRAVEPRCQDDDAFLTTRINWVVQSGAVDFLHLMLVCMRWLSQGRVRFCLSFHDEVRYLVPSHLRYEAALALHITNLLTRAFCAHRLGLSDLPQAVAFFSSVEVDSVLRKEAKDDCITPSNPHGLAKGYNVPPGESLDIFEAIRKTNGTISQLHKKNRCVTIVDLSSALRDCITLSQAQRLNIGLDLTRRYFS